MWRFRLFWLLFSTFVVGVSGTAVTIRTSWRRERHACPGFVQRRTVSHGHMPNTQAYTYTRVSLCHRHPSQDRLVTIEPGKNMRPGTTSRYFLCNISFLGQCTHYARLKAINTLLIKAQVTPCSVSKDSWATNCAIQSALGQSKIMYLPSRWPAPVVLDKRWTISYSMEIFPTPFVPWFPSLVKCQ